MNNAYQPLSDQWPTRAVVFGASGGIGGAISLKLATDGVRVACGGRSGTLPVGNDTEQFHFDYSDESSISDAGEKFRDTPPDLVIVATGVLTLDSGEGPERSLRKLDADTMATHFHVNTIGPALVAKHFLPVLPRDRRSVFAVLTARVGSIGDNRLGGWHSYRASKAALNMLVRNFAIEMGRTHDKAVVCGLHPGTVDTQLSEPFQGNVPEGQLFSPEQSAGHMLDVLQNLTPADSGKIFAWDGSEIPF